MKRFDESEAATAIIRKGGCEEALEAAAVKKMERKEQQQKEKEEKGQDEEA